MIPLHFILCAVQMVWYKFMVFFFNLSKNNHLKMWVLHMKTTATRQLSTATARAWGMPGWTVQTKKKQRKSEHLRRVHLAHFPQDRPRLGIFKVSRPVADDLLDCGRSASIPVLSRELSGKHNWIKGWSLISCSRVWSSSSNGAVLVQHTFLETTERPGCNFFSIARKYREEYSELDILLDEGGLFKIF